ncbi:SPRY domain-containing SOCS box protein 1-like [Clavelina lepadiformis]|uniref:SPRY domain-containing SOCS box protein 1 n=1 Tax=Clavelina lepadiformis TaxID=159417 RepID=A0ABP0F3A9_CLALP
MGQKVSRDPSARQLSFIEPFLSRATARNSAVGSRSARRENNSPLKNRRSGHRDRESHRHFHQSFNRNRSHGKCLSASGIVSECPHRLDVLLDMPSVGPEIQMQHGWNPEDKSVNVFVKDDGMIMHRHPVAQSTDGARGRFGYSKGLHCWEISWNARQRGTHAMVGVCTVDAPLTCIGYKSLIGQNENSWGWDLGRNKLFHGGKGNKNEKRTYPAFLNSDESFVVPEKILVVLDMEEGTLSFVADNQYLGVAFRGLKGKTLYPTISCVWGHCEVGIKYLNGLKPAPLPLNELCRRRIRMCLGKNNLNRVQSLPLPLYLRQYVLYR